MIFDSYFTFASSLIIFFILGYFILEKLITEEYEVKSWTPILVFCTNFSFSIVFLELLLFEILKLGSEK